MKTLNAIQIIACIALTGCGSSRPRSLEDSPALREYMAKSAEMSWYAPLLISISDKSRAFYQKHKRSPKSLDECFPGNSVPVKFSTEMGYKTVFLNKSDIQSKCKVKESGTVLAITYKYKDSDWTKNEIDLTAP